MMLLIFLLIIFGSDEEAGQKPSYNLNDYQATGELSLFKKDVFGDPWQYQVLQPLEDPTAYQTIVSKVFNNQPEENDKVATSALRFSVQTMPVILDTFPRFSGSNTSMSRMLILFEDTQGGKQARSFPLFQKLLISGKKDREGQDIDPEKQYFFAGDIHPQIRELFSGFGITLYLPKQTETDQALIFCVLNLPPEFFSEIKRQIGGRVKIKGILIDTVTYFDPCMWCSPLFKIKEIRDRIAATVKRALTSAELPYDPNSFKLAFNFIAAQGCGFRPEGTFSRDRPPKPVFLSTYEVFDYND